MLINGIDLSTLGIQLYDRVINSNKVQTSRDWLEGDNQPTFIRQQDKFKNIQLKFLVLKDNEAEAFLVMSKLTAMLRKATIVFDDINLLFDVTMRGAAKQSRLKNGNFILTFDLLSDYAKGGIEVYTTDTVATDYFKLKILYYKGGNILLTTDEVMIKASDFNQNTTFASLGVEINKYQPEYHNNGTIANFNNQELTFENLKATGTLIINYAPTIFQKQVTFFRQTEEGGDYSWIEDGLIGFTKEQVDNATSLGDLIDFSQNKPNGTRVLTDFNSGLSLDFNFVNLMSLSYILVRYEIITNEQRKEITVTFYEEDDNGDYTFLDATSYLVSEGDILPGSKITDFINVNLFKPEKYYNSGAVADFDTNTVVTFDSLPALVRVNYPLTENRIYVEYFYGSYPNWSRITTHTHSIKYNTAYDNAQDILDAVGINLDRYLTVEYNAGALFNVQGSIASFDDLIDVGILQVFYSAKNFDLVVDYYQQDTKLESRTIQINATQFLNSPVLAQIIDINLLRPEGYIFDADESYQGAVELATLLANAPIKIAYKEVDVVRTKSIVIKYKQELSTMYSTINTSIITIEESQVGGGVALASLFDLNAFKPEYYNDGILDGASASAILSFEDIQGTYNVLYAATPYSTSVRYYTDEVADENWIGSSTLNYTVLSFSVGTTLTDLGLDINGFKPSYCGNGELQYTGPVNFSALRELESIDIIYTAESEPEDPSGIDYPHRILFLQHNDMGDFEQMYPSWTMNHAYINTGVTCDDMSKLTVLVDTYRVFETEPLYNVNVDEAYLFGSVSAGSRYYIKYCNNTYFGPDAEMTGINTFNVAAGNGTPELIVEESSSEGFSSNTGISASTRDGYSYGTITFTHLVQSNSARMAAPLYLFACDYNGYYRGGIAGVGIKSCKIYYDGTLIRDYVPVAFYDKIGDKIAPSNCLYDKVTQNFFEDARSLNSFNIMDDPDYTDENPEHKIGKCYVNYYKDNVLFNVTTYYFRASDFIGETNWVEETNLFMDDYQPNYCGSGVITNLAELGTVNFDNVNNFTFHVNYTSLSYHITVNYYRDSAEDENNLIASDDIELAEKDFLLNPTFGQLIPLLKYKPLNYKVNYEYPETKVTLRRILEHSPYTIVYTEVQNPEVYTTKVSYWRKHFGITPLDKFASYEKVGEDTLSLDETQFADGEFIEKYINFNAYKPVSPVSGVDFYLDGANYGWYLEDENLITPDVLKEEYRVIYDPKEIDIEIRYYTDEVDEENFIGSNMWPIKVDDWPDGEEFQIVDELPNVYFNACKPIICWGGVLADSTAWYTFASLVETGHVDIVYETKEQPHDPDDEDWPSKILWYDTGEANRNVADAGIDNDKRIPYSWFAVDYMMKPTLQSYYPKVNTIVPYLDLGYTPKELGRLKAEIKGYCLNSGCTAAHISSYSLKGDDFAGFFGYYDAQDTELTKEDLGKSEKTVSGYHNKYGEGSFRFVGHTTVYGHDMGGQIQQAQTVDGHTYYSHATLYSASGIYPNALVESVRELKGEYRRGQRVILNEQLQPVYIFHDYKAHLDDGYGEYPNYSMTQLLTNSEKSPAVLFNTNFMGNENIDSPFKIHGKIGNAWDLGHDITGVTDEQLRTVAANPLTMTIDGYNNYMEAYDYTNYLHPLYTNLDNTDIDVWEKRTSPRGSLVLGVTRNPATGKINWKKTSIVGVLSGVSAFHSSSALAILLSQNPYVTGFSKSVTVESVTLVPAEGEDNKWTYKNETKTISVAWHGTAIDVFPSPARMAVWHLKIWDQNRLVRDLVPVAEGDRIYDFTAPANGMFDRVTEIFFGNVNEGGTYRATDTSTPIWGQLGQIESVIEASDVAPLHVCDDWTLWGKVAVNYYDENNDFIDNHYVDIPVLFREPNETVYEVLRYNDFKPDDFHTNGMFDADIDFESYENLWYDRTTHLIYDDTLYGKWAAVGSADWHGSQILKLVAEMGTVNVYYRLLTFTKTVEYYRGNKRVGSRDIFYNIQDIRNAQTLEDLGIDVDLYASEDYKPGRIAFNESILAEDDIKAFIDAPSPVVIYDEYTAEEKPDLLYVNYYRGGASDSSITLNQEDVNYFDCDLDARVLNPNGAIKYINHYHTALYEDEKQDYFIPYQVDVDVNYCAIHKGPGRAYSTLAEITDHGRYTVIEEKRGWGRLREYPKGWILLSFTHPVTGPGRNPSYDANLEALVTIPYATMVTVTKLTIDRLWAWVPEYSSWVKAEDLSFTQAGRLYNALASQVIHLDEVDWSNISNWTDLGINLNQYRLRYHDTATVSYDGALTRAGLTAAHSIDVINPETIYAYNVVYYKDTFVSEETATGRATANTLIPIYEDIEKQTQIGSYEANDTFIFYGSAPGNTDMLQTEDGYIDIEDDYTITRASALNLDYPLVQNTTNRDIQFAPTGPFGTQYYINDSHYKPIQPGQIVQVFSKVPVEKINNYSYMDQRYIFNLSHSNDANTSDSSAMYTYPHLDSFPDGLELIHEGSIIPTGDYYGYGIPSKDITIYNYDKTETVGTITTGTRFKILDYEENRYQVQTGWVDKRYVKIVDFGPFKVSTQRGFKNTEIGRDAFSCNISNWNPDWDVFIETSWQYEKIITPGEAVANDTITVYTGPDESQASYGTFAANTLFTFTQDKFEVAEGYGFWYEVSTTGIDKGYVKASDVTVTSELIIEDDYTKPINPTLYRDTPMTLTWEFFGMGRNRFKPSEEYEDGIFLWNPRSYDNEDVYFTFEELVTTGTQVVLYLPIYSRYKALFNNHSQIHISLPMESWSNAPKATDERLYDFEIRSNWIVPDAGHYIDEHHYYLAGIAAYGATTIQQLKQTLNAPNSVDNIYTYNVSNKRNATFVIAYQNDLNGYHSGYHTGSTKITRNYNLENPNLYRFSENDEAYRTNSYGTYSDPLSGYNYSLSRYLHENKELFPRVAPSYLPTLNGYPEDEHIFYSAKVWKNYFLQHFIVPLKKGYVLNGVKIREGCVADLLTGQIFYATNAFPWTQRNNLGNSIQVTYPISPPKIFQLHERVDFSTTPTASLDDVMTFDKDDLNQFMLSRSNNTERYKQPSSNATMLNRVNQNVVVPIFYTTEDELHGVEGLWFGDSSGWYEGSDLSAVASGTYPETLEKVQFSTAIKTDAETPYTIYRYKEPTVETTNGSLANNSVRNIYAKYGDNYWIGTGWIRKQDTSENVSTFNTTKNYVVSADLLDVYQYPIANEAYRLDGLQHGERISVDTYLTNDERWQYIDDFGWINTENTVSEVI